MIRDEYAQVGRVTYSWRGQREGTRRFVEDMASALGWEGRRFWAGRRMFHCTMLAPFPVDSSTGNIFLDLGKMGTLFLPTQPQL